MECVQPYPTTAPGVTSSSLAFWLWRNNGEHWAVYEQPEGAIFVAINGIQLVDFKSNHRLLDHLYPKLSHPGLTETKNFKLSCSRISLFHWCRFRHNKVRCPGVSRHFWLSWNWSHSLYNTHGSDTDFGVLFVTLLFDLFRASPLPFEWSAEVFKRSLHLDLLSLFIFTRGFTFLQSNLLKMSFVTLFPDGPCNAKIDFRHLERDLNETEYWRPSRYLSSFVFNRT